MTKTNHSSRNHNSPASHSSHLPFCAAAITLLLTLPAGAEQPFPSATTRPAATQPAVNDWRAGLERKLSLVIPQIDFDDTEMNSYITFLREVRNVNIVLDPDCEAADKKVTCHYKDTSFKTIISETLRGQGLWYRLQDGAVYVFKKSRPRVSLPLMADNAPAWEKELRKKMGLRWPKLDFDDTELGSVMLFFKEVSGANISLDEGVDKTPKVGIHTADLTMQQNLNLICQMHRLQYRLTEKGLAVEKFKPAKSPIKVGKDTTRITGPLREDGTVDFAAAINEQYSKGVTKDNNAAVVFLQVMDTSKLDKEWLSAVLKNLGVGPNLPGPFLVTEYDRKDNYAQGDLEYNSAIKDLWAAKDHPALAQWLKANQEPLDKLVEGTTRPRYYMFCVRPEDQDELAWASPMASILHPYLNIGRMLLIRANLALAEHRYDDARRDILALYRLGSLIDQDCTLIARMIGASLGAMADLEIQHVCGDFDVKTRKALMDDIRQMPPSPPVATLIDGAERFWAIQSLSQMAVDPDALKASVAQWKSVLGPVATTTQLGENPFIDYCSRMDFLADIASEVDWNKVLAAMNTACDRNIEATRVQSPEMKRQKVAALRVGQDEINKRAKNRPNPTASGDAKTSWAIDCVQSDMGSGGAATLIRADQMTDRATAMRRMTVICLALSLHKADKGRYPQTLADLAPAYLKAVPTDIFTGKDFVYKPLENGYTLYSVGENGIDNGGETGKPGCDDMTVRTKQ